MNKSMTYFLFDLTVLAILSMAATRRMLIDDNSTAAIAQECHTAYSNRNHMRHDLFKASPSPEDIPDLRRTISQDEDTSSDDDTDVYHKVGTSSLVELYGDSSYFAAPAIIVGSKKDQNSIKYNLKNVIHDTHPTGVDQQFVHPYHVYNAGTKAICNVGAMRKIYMVPCNILSHSINKIGFITYQVSYVNNESESFPKYLPFSRVERDLRTQEKERVDR